MNDGTEETALEMARRHVRESEVRIRYQADLIDKIRAHGGNTDLSEQLLEAYNRFLRLARDHLKHEEEAEAWRNP